MKKILFVSAVAFIVGFGVIAIFESVQNRKIASLAPSPTEGDSCATSANGMSDQHIGGATETRYRETVVTENESYTHIHLEGVDGGAGMDILVLGGN